MSSISADSRRITSRLALISLAALALLIVGCVTIADRVASRLTETTIDQDVEVVRGQLVELRRCLEERGGSCQGGSSTPLPGTSTQGNVLQPVDTRLDGSLGQSVNELGDNHPATDARRVLEHPFLGKIHSLYNRLHGLHRDEDSRALAEEKGADGATELTFKAPIPEVRDFFEHLHSSLNSGSWDALADHADAYHKQHPDDASTRQHARTMAYIRAYFTAYFENGRFVQLELDTQDVTALLEAEGGELAGKVESLLAQRFPTLCGTGLADCSSLEAELKKQLGSQISKRIDKTYIFGKIQTTGFVSRDGAQLSVPAIHIDLDPLGQKAVSVDPVDLSALGGDLVTVLLEAIFDAHEGLPAVSGATGRQLEDPALALPAFVSPLDQVDTQDFEKIADLSHRSATSVRALLSRALQGVGPFGLNNPALESMIGAAIGTTVAKITTKASWCFYACGLAGDAQQAKQQLEDAARQAGKEVEQAAKREGERIRLKLEVR